MAKTVYRWIPASIFLTAFLVQSCLPPSGGIVRRDGRQNLDDHTVRVLIAESKSPITIFSKSRVKIRGIKSGKVLLDTDGRSITLNPEKILTPLIVESWNSPIEVDKKAYRGSMEIHNVLGKISVINVLSMGDYLKSVIPGEIPANWNAEALKAQAIASRTYAYHHILGNKNRKLYDLDATTSFQVYKGMVSEKPFTNDAVESTSGEVLMYNGGPILAFFHSTCGGRTADNGDLWEGKNHPYLKSVPCPYCESSPHYRWSTDLTLDKIRESLQRHNQFTGRIRSIAFKSHEGRVTDVIVRHTQGVTTMKGNQFRLLFPTDSLKSTFFVSKKGGRGLHFEGRGWGHGVGLCQWGARGMAEKGFNYKKILQYYYRNGRIERPTGNDI